MSGFDSMFWDEFGSMDVERGTYLQGNAVGDVSARDCWTSSWSTARMGKVKRMAALVDGGMNPDEQNLKNQRPLHFACIYGHGEMVKFLLDNGCDANEEDDFHKTPLRYAFDNDRLDAVRVSLGVGLDCTVAFVTHLLCLDRFFWPARSVRKRK